MSGLTSHLTKVQKALRNDLNKGLNHNNGEFSRKLGQGFNMDGIDPSGQKVGLLDRHHLWSYLCDPFNHQMRGKFLLQVGMAELMNEMIDTYIPLDGDGSNHTRIAVKDEFMDFHTQQGKWQQCFDKPLPDTPSIEQLTENNKAFTVDDIVKFVEESGNLARRFRWFETYAANSNFYLLVAKPLLSMGIVGSMEVERRVKPLKDSILSKKRNRLSDSKAVALWRASENLKHIMQAKKVLGKSITDSKPVQL
eukprot:scaffold155275_cov66-Cyclotella_meneghiniana.AAC.2